MHHLSSHLKYTSIALVIAAMATEMCAIAFGQEGGATFTEPAHIEFDRSSSIDEGERGKASELLISAWRNSEQLRSGQFDAIVAKGDASGDRHHTLSRQTCTFDFTQSLMRYDVKPLEGEAEVRYAVTPSGSVTWESDKNWLHRETLTTISAASRRGLWLLDPRCIAWSPPHHQCSVADPYGVLRNDFAKADKAVKFSEAGTGRSEIWWLPHPCALISIVFDVHGNSTPIRYSLWQAPPSDARVAHFKPEIVVHSTWEELSGIAVPRKVICHSVGDVPSVLTVDLSWQQVNDPVRADTFKLAGLKLPVKTTVRDLVDGKSVFVGELDNKGAVQVVNPTLRRQLASDRRSTSLWLLCLNGLVGTVVVVVVLRYRHIRRS